MKAYFLPKELKLELRKVWGKPIFGKRSKVKKEFLKILEKRNLKNKCFCKWRRRFIGDPAVLLSPKKEFV